MAGKKPKLTNEERAERLAAHIKEQAKKGVGKGIVTARAFLLGRLKETLSVPAPRKRVTGKGGEIYYRATTPAIPGAPPRKLSARLIASLAARVEGNSIVIGSNARGFPSIKNPVGYLYGKHHEIVDPGRSSSGKHQWIRPTVKQYRHELQAIVRGKVSAEVTT